MERFYVSASVKVVSVFPLFTGWPLMLGLTGVPALIELVLLPFFPESPRYMLIQRGDEKKATKGKKTPNLCGDRKRRW